MSIKEVPVPKQRNIYRIFEVDPATQKKTDTGKFRVRRRVRIGSEWSMETCTFGSYEAARTFRNGAPTGTPTREKLTSRLESEKYRFPNVFERFLCHKLKEKKLADSTIEKYRDNSRHLVFFAKLDVRDLDPTLVDRWIDFLHDPEYLETQNTTRVNYDHEYTLLSNILRYFKDHENFDYVVPLLKRHRERLCSKSRSVKDRIRFLTEVQQANFLREMAAQDELMHDLAIVQIDTGMRISEVLALQARQVTLESNEILVDQHLYWERKKGGVTRSVLGTKGGPSRVIPMTGRCKSTIEKLLTRDHAKARLFERAGEWIDYRFVQNVYDRVFRKLEYRHSGTHTLRHTFAVSFLDKTRDIYALQQLLGHKDLSTTQIYAKYTNEAVKRSFKVFDGKIAGGFVSPLVSRDVG